MGNCQAAEAATVVIQHGDGKVERVYWSISAGDVMAANPGHYVAHIITSNSNNNGDSSSSRANNNSTVKHLKLLRPEDTLHIGHVYRLVSFEEVMKEFASKKHARLSKLLISLNKEKSSKKDGRRRRAAGSGSGAGDGIVTDVGDARAHDETEAEAEAQAQSSSENASAGRPMLRHSQWRPALQSIAENSGT
ncbi:hypothetical protein IHE45_19G110300 [Dioscorea alata]|uniref:Uncharacterized protein n=1 Tax=Dioscorea alata TaxID=55571 RepID=A0ACB7U0Q8_DIOAL|nr:hypothetical protein IHE45_19G110300 [Dioscorea alata]